MTIATVAIVTLGLVCGVLVLAYCILRRQEILARDRERLEDRQFVLFTYQTAKQQAIIQQTPEDPNAFGV